MLGSRGGRGRCASSPSPRRSSGRRRRTATSRSRASGSPSSRGSRAEARAEAFPQLTGTASYTRMWRKPSIVINGQPITFGTDHNTIAAASVDQLLWDGGRVFKAMRAARSEERRGQELIRATEQQIAASR